MLYEEYPEYKDYNVYFTHNGYNASVYSLNGGAVFINAMSYIKNSCLLNA